MRRLLFLVPMLCGSLAHAGTYEMKDLEALEKQEAWDEAVAHLEDIAPSKRNDTWQRIADKAAVGHLMGLVAQPNTANRDDIRKGHQALAEVAELQKRYPTLKKSRTFMQGRAEVGLKAFAKTYSDSRHSSGDDPWLQELRAFVDEDTMTPDLPLRAGKLVTGRLVAYIAVPFFKKAINGGSGAGACKDADVKAALVSALSDEVWTDDAKELVRKSCFGDVRGSIEAALGKEGADKLKANACPIFAEKKAAIAACK